MTPPGFVVRGGPAPKLARAQLAAGVGAEGTAKSFAAQSGAQPPRHAVGPTSTNSDAHPRCRPSDRTEVVAPLAQWPPSAARISPGEQLARREGLSRPSAECAADAENYETGRRHSGLMELLGRICGGRQLLTAAADKGDSVGAHAGRPAPPRLNAVRSGQSGNSSGR
jgi:hypothetical protein